MIPVCRLSAILVVSLIAMTSVAQPAPQPTVLPGADSFVYKTIDAIELHLHLFRAERDDPAPAIVFFFGGGWQGGSVNQFVPQSQHLQHRGMTAIVADYRVRGRHGGSEIDAS